MLRKLFVLPVLGLFVLPAVVKAQEYGFDAGSWELTLSGSGQNDNSFRGTSAGADVSLGYFFNDNLEVGVRDGLTYTDIGGTKGSSWAGNTDVFVDWNIDWQRWQPFVGANIGYIYGDTHNTWEAGPEIGVKYFLTQSAFVELMAQYEFFFDNGSNSFGSNSFSDGLFRYFLGLGVKL